MPKDDVAQLEDQPVRRRDVTGTENTWRENSLIINRDRT